MLLTTLPHDILILVLQHLPVQGLATLSITCRSLHDLITEFGWKGHLRTNPRPSYSLSRARAHWSPRTQVRYDVLTDCAWSRSEFIARPLSRPWSGKMQPILAINSSRLVVAAGPSIYSYKFGDSKGDESPPLSLEGFFSFTRPHGRQSDITAITFIDDGGLDQTLHVGFQDGRVQRVTFDPPSPNAPAGTTLRFTSSATSELRDGDFLESLTSERNLLLSLSSSGSATLTDLHKPTSPPSTISLDARSWASHMCLHASGPYAAFGTSSLYPLRIHSITDDQLMPTPSAILYSTSSSNMSYQPSSSAVYGISQGPVASPWGASPQILVAGWFDGQVCCYDLRSSSRIAAGSGPGPVPLRPVLSLADPLQLESIYSVSCGGGSASHIAAGSARHSVVSFWDVRSPRTGWSVHAPGNDRSPVYSIILESSRLFGATQSRPFVYDFGPGVTSSTYPSLPEAQGIDGLKRKKGSIGYYVTKYPHTTRISTDRHERELRTI
ncbi:hypothetical protein Hypma_000829 [Hypsizygus marmoreus]|uniref:F-box domain-containing protein n=1 Tax=Hypsizygus marmoreus TaxID=39966 RepID=A0A369JDP5_HYPMA|nr:hypothetical protein Hypma_000829 [Hypsizygus marmoreus]